MTSELTTEAIADRIDQRLAEIGKSARAVSIEATGNPDAIRYIRARNAMPSAARLVAIEKRLGVPAGFLSGDGTQRPSLAEENANLRRALVRLSLAAGRLNVALDGQERWRRHRQAVLSAMQEASLTLGGPA